MPINSLDSSIARAFKIAEVPLKTTPAKNLFPLAVNSSGGPAGTIGSESATFKSVAREQYEHYRGRVYSAIRVIKQRIAAQPFYVARVLAARSARSRIKTNKDIPGFLKMISPERLDIFEQHPLLETIASPNELMVQSALWDVTVANLCVTGRCLWILGWEDRKLSITPIPTTWAMPIHANGRLFDSWEVRPPWHGGKPLKVSHENMAHFFFPDPANPLMATSPLQKQAEGILADESIAKAQQVAFENGIHPAVALIAGEASTSDGKRRIRLEEQQRRQLVTWMKHEYMGVKKWGLPIVLDALIRDIKMLSNKPAEMDFLESSGITKSMVYEGFGVNPVAAGQVEGSNRASSAIADYHLISNAVNPIIELMSQTINKWIVPFYQMGNQKIVAWIPLAKPHDPELELTAYRFAAKYGAVTKNEIRQFIDLPRIDEEEFDRPANDSPNQGTMSDVDRDQLEGRDEDVSGDESQRLEVEEDRKSFTKNWLKQHGTQEARLNNAVFAFLQSQVKEIANQIQGAIQPDKIDEIVATVYSPSEWDIKLKNVVRKHLIDSATLGAARIISKSKAPGVPDIVVDAIRRQIDEIMDQPYWIDINNTTRQLIVDKLREASLSGTPLTNLSQDLISQFTEINRKRSLLIARSETTGSANAGAQAAAETLGVSGTKEWGSIIDDDTRDAHLTLDGKVVGVNENFDVGGFQAPYPGHHSLPAAQRANCRCVLIHGESFKSAEVSTPSFEDQLDQAALRYGLNAQEKEQLRREYNGQS